MVKVVGGGTLSCVSGGRNRYAVLIQEKKSEGSSLRVINHYGWKESNVYCGRRKQENKSNVHPQMQFDAMQIIDEFLH